MFKYNTYKSWRDAVGPTSNSYSAIREFEPHQRIHTVSLDKTRNRHCLVLVGSEKEIERDFTIGLNYMNMSNKLSD